jgi:hypothetical protein
MCVNCEKNGVIYDQTIHKVVNEMFAQQLLDGKQQGIN